ncbi:glycosyltransferase family 2 protein [Haloarcula onubensis]|uniref:Glycosyltransferase family 2 protein n=1 Tax=Haloarcula onubensis TaxID=2950539 RepID=A0ABU2FW91_9EURY|nr:glycosyltransferase family 2 protein [Halomicroarcula sp. S3CR25-11]MDS0284552.1 glycosyltransferase family 2 protein [Halomicroarcula sp. S3CR25-11]
MEEQSTANVGQTVTDGVTTAGDVAVVRSLVATGEDRQLAVVTVTTTGTEPTGVRLTETVPETHGVAVSSGDRGRGAGGVISVEGTVRPESALRFGYVLTGPVAADLPEPRVELPADWVPEEGVSAALVAADGDRTRLDVRTETLLGQAQLRLPLLTLGGPTATDEALLNGEAAPRSMAGAAVGVVLTPRNEDAALRTVVRASQRGHSVLVTYADGGDGSEILSKLSSLGAVVLDPPAAGATQSQLHRHLSAAARGRGLPGIVLQTRDCPRIDYDRTADAYDSADYEVVAIPESWSTPSEGPRVVVGIPAYNAASSIASVVEQATAFADDVVVVDDGSADETAVRAREAGASVVVHELNRGYGGALKTLFRTADDRGAEHLVVIDADGQHDPADIPMLVESQERDGTDIVIGSRYVGERDTKIPFVRSVGLAVINGLTNVSMGKLRPSGFVHDTQSGYRAYSRRAVRSLAADPMIGNNMGASTDILYHAHRARLSVGEIPTTIYYDVENSSSQGSLSHGVDLLRNIAWTVEYGRPLLVVGAPGVVSTVMGIAVTVLLLTSYLDTGALAAHEILVSILFAVGGMLLCIAAILMHVLNVHPTMKRLTTGGND